MLEAISIV